MSLVMLLSMACIATDIASNPTGMEITKTKQALEDEKQGISTCNDRTVEEGMILAGGQILMVRLRYGSALANEPA
jgi:hypothetical protein